MYYHLYWITEGEIKRELYPEFSTAFSIARLLNRPWSIISEEHGDLAICQSKSWAYQKIPK